MLGVKMMKVRHLVIECMRAYGDASANLQVQHEKDMALAECERVAQQLLLLQQQVQQLQEARTKAERDVETHRHVAQDLQVWS